MADSLQDILGQIDSLQGEAHRKDEALAQARRDLREAIRGGQTTGDHVKDFLLVAYGPRVDEGTERQYRALVDRFAGKKDGSVLLCYQRQEPMMHSVIHQPNMPTIAVSRFELGVLDEDPRLDVNQGMIAFPTKPSDKPVHAEYGDQFSHRSKWEVKDGSLALAPWDFAPSFEDTTLMRKCGSIDDMSSLGERFSGVYMGDEIVALVNRLPGLGKKSFGDSPEFGLLGTGIDEVTYAKGLILLGADLPPLVKERYDCAIDADKKRVISKLYRVLLHRSSANLSSTRESLREDIPGLLREAVELGMHRDTTRWPLDLSVGFEVGSYVRDLCSEYKVKIS